MPDFSKSKGGEVAEASAKTGRDTADFFTLKEGAVCFVRPVSDIRDLITVQVHMGVPTRPGPKGAKSWPQQMSAVCQNDTVFMISENGGPDGTPLYEDGYGKCYIHLNMQEVKGKFGGSVATPRPQTWGLLAMREPVKEEGTGKLLGFRDITKNWTDPEGRAHRIPRIVVASQSYSNFWGAFISSAFMTGSICCFDYQVKRTGSAEYEISAGRETTDHQPGTESWNAYLQAVELTGMTAERIISDQSSPRYYGRFFDPSVPFDDEDQDGGAAEAAASAADEIDKAQADALREKMAASFGMTQPT
jgi:hypothetical protein